MRRAIAQEQQERRTTDSYASTLTIAASIIVRLARDQDITTPSPRLTSVVSVTLLLGGYLEGCLIGQPVEAIPIPFEGTRRYVGKILTLSDKLLAPW